MEINSSELVPGDIFILPEDGLAMPCDAILINGKVIMNEAILTGESTPVIKYNMTYSDDIYNTNNSDYDKYMLFAGTKIVIISFLVQPPSTIKNFKDTKNPTNVRIPIKIIYFTESLRKSSSISFG